MAIKIQQERFALLATHRALRVRTMVRLVTIKDAHNAKLVTIFSTLEHNHV